MPGEGLPSRFPFEVAFQALHEYRGHNRKRSKIAQALSSGGFSLIFPIACTCQADVTAMFSGLLDAGFVVVVNNGEGGNAEDQAH